MTNPETEILQLLDQYEAATDADERESVADRLLRFEPAAVADEPIACLLLHVAREMAADIEVDRLLTWAEQLENKFDQSGAVVGLHAALWWTLLQLADEDDLNGSVDQLPEVQQIEERFQRSLQLDPNVIGSQLLAGDFRMENEDTEGAKRALTAAFELDSANDAAALRLCQFYVSESLPERAQNVLEECERAGGRPGHVAWEALMQAIDGEQYEQAVLHAELFDQVQPDEDGVNYFRAFALVWLQQPERALAAVDAELKFAPEETFHLDAVRCVAMWQLKRSDEAAALLSELLQQPFGRLEFLTETEIKQAMQLIATCLQELDDADSAEVSESDRSTIRQLVQNGRQRLLRLGLYLDDWFEAATSDVQATTVGLYQVLVEQPLSSDWDSSLGCLPGEEGWSAYHAVWGVIAKSEADARELVLEWQNRCESEPARVVDLSLVEQGAVDVPGVRWQGARWNVD